MVMIYKLSFLPVSCQFSYLFQSIFSKNWRHYKLSRRFHCKPLHITSAYRTNGGVRGACVREVSDCNDRHRHNVNYIHEFLCGSEITVANCTHACAPPTVLCMWKNEGGCMFDLISFTIFVIIICLYHMFIFVQGPILTSFAFLGVLPILLLIRYVFYFKF